MWAADCHTVHYVKAFQTGKCQATGAFVVDVEHETLHPGIVSGPHSTIEHTRRVLLRLASASERITFRRNARQLQQRVD